MRCIVLLLASLSFATAAPAQTLVRTYGTGCCAFGWAVADTPDLDGDGRRDFVAGAIQTGQLVSLSTASGAALATNQVAGSDLGYAVATVPDVDRDGVADVAAGAPAATPNSGGGPGRVLLYSGRTGAQIRQFTPPAGSTLFGSAVAGIQDLDNDGAGELMIGAPGAGNGAGRVHVMSGASGAVLFSIEGSVAAGSFGAGVAVLPDADGDGVQDIVVGAPRAGGGHAYVYSSVSRLLLRDLQPAVPSTTFGEFFVASAGDVDADGRRDIYVGAYGERAGSGGAYVFSGADGSRLRYLQGSDREGLGPGRSAGDMNGDRHDDLIVGSFSYSGAGVNQGGRVRVFSGADGSVLQEVHGMVAGAQLGFDATGIGDVTGDGRLDFIVSAAGSNLGSVFLYAGSVTPQASFAINGGLSGTWSDPGSSGQGFQFEVIESRGLIAGGWFTHASLPPASGAAQRWFSFAGPYEGDQASMSLLFTRGGRFAAGGGVQTVEVGTLRFVFADCTHATATYAVRSNAVSGEGDPAGGALLEGSIALTRLTPDERCARPALVSQPAAAGPTTSD